MTETHLPATPAASRAPATHADGSAVVRNYGSAPGELSACVCRVGIVDRADLARILTSGPPAAIDAVLARLTGDQIAVGGGVRLADAWWCRPTADAALVLCSRESLPRLSRLLRDAAKRHHAVAVRDGADEDAFVGIVGRRTADVLDALGVYGAHGDPRRAAPCSTMEIAGAEVTWLLESDVCAVACVPREHLSALHRAIEERARPFGIARVGREAFDNYMILERRRRHTLA